MATFEDLNMMASTTSVVKTDQKNQPARSLTFSIENILYPKDNINTQFYGHRPPALPTPTSTKSIPHTPKKRISVESEKGSCDHFNESGEFSTYHRLRTILSYSLVSYSSGCCYVFIVSRLVLFALLFGPM